MFFLEQLEALASQCELLVSQGHNTSTFNPYQYSIKKLVTLSSLATKREKEKIVTIAMIDHMSRLGFETGDTKPFNEILDRLTEE